MFSFKLRNTTHCSKPCFPHTIELSCNPSRVFTAPSWILFLLLAKRVPFFLCLSFQVSRHAAWYHPPLLPFSAASPSRLVDGFYYCFAFSCIWGVSSVPLWYLQPLAQSTVNPLHYSCLVSQRRLQQMHKNDNLNKLFLNIKPGGLCVGCCCWLGDVWEPQCWCRMVQPVR